MTTMASTLCICATIKAVDLFLTFTSILQLDNDQSKIDTWQGRQRYMNPHLLLCETHLSPKQFWIQITQNL